ncbi:hypothetical protein OQA88_3245 [Cercophora sp. LCS_1]
MGVTDARFDLTVYGYFLEEIPSRLGRNLALDAAVQTLTVAFSFLLSRQTGSDRAEVLRSYNDALRCLRDCLNDPMSAHTSETLCAVYLVMVCQGWIGRRGDFLPSHGGAIAHLLNAAMQSDNLSTTAAFETGMVATLGMIVTMESFVNPNLELDPRVLDFPRPSGPQETVQAALNVPSLELRALARTAQLIRGTSTGSGTNEYLSQIQSSYKQTENDCITLKEALSQTPWPQPPSLSGNGTSTVAKSSPLPVVRETRLHVRTQASYGVLLTLAIMLSSILQEADEQYSLASQANTHVDEILRLAQQAERYRPLGSSGTPLYLITAWSVTSDAARQAELERLIGNYQSDFPSANWFAVAQSIKPKLQ